jgi:uncharacterized protein YbjT (DUF2867 family)
MSAAIKIAVAGATGRVGHHVVDVLEARGQDVVPISRASGVDLISGKGLTEALAGVECVIEAASSPTPDEAEATKFFTTAARNLQAAGVRTGVRRIVVVSIIGIDRFKAGYMAAKVAQERAFQAGPIPVQILRAAQFHEFVAQLVAWGRQGEVSFVPKMRTQLVAARSVAEALADMATEATPPAAAGAPIPEIAGPREENLVEAAVRLVARHGERLRIQGVVNPDDPGAELYQAGALLPGPHAILAGPTFEQWLESAS